jgi:hypothetical protein
MLPLARLDPKEPKIERATSLSYGHYAGICPRPRNIAHVTNGYTLRFRNYDLLNLFHSGPSPSHQALQIGLGPGLGLGLGLESGLGSGPTRFSLQALESYTTKSHIQVGQRAQPALDNDR